MRAALGLPTEIVTSGPARSASANAAMSGHVISAKPFERQQNAPAATLAEIGPERLVEPLVGRTVGARPASPALPRARSIPARRRRWCRKAAIRPHHHAGAGLARARALGVRNRHQHGGAVLGDKAFYGGPDQASMPNPASRHGPHARSIPAWRARRAAPRLPGARLWMASAIARKHRDRQHQRRLAHGLGAVDRRPRGSLRRTQRDVENPPARRDAVGIL